MARIPPLAADGLGEPGWATSLVFATAATLVVCYPPWPGFMSFDSVYALQQAREGVETMLWPPLHSYMFRVSDALGLGTGGVLAFQTFALFAAAAVILHLMVRNRVAAATLCLLFAALVAIFPTLLGSMLVHWRDVPTASFAFLGVALWLLAARYRAPLLLAPAAAALGCTVGLRYNAIVLVGFILLLMAWRPLMGRPGRFARPFAVLCIVAALAAAWASTQWRLPDLVKMQAPNAFGGVQSFDLVGISACADRDYLPLGMTGGVALSPYHIRRNYDPRHLNLTFRPKRDVPALVDTDRESQVAAAWRAAILKEPGCYLAHRRAVFVEQMGLSDRGVFYPTHGDIDENAYGLVVAHPGSANLASAYVQTRADPIWRRPAWLYALAAVLVGLAIVRDRRQAPLLLVLLAGAFTYAGLLFFVSPAADARYIFPSNVTCALLVALSLGLIGQAGAGRRPDRPTASRRRRVVAISEADPGGSTLNAALPLAAVVLLALASCDKPKPRPLPPPSGAPASVTTAAAASAGLPKRPEMATFSLDAINQAPDPLNQPATIKAGVPITFSGFGFDTVAKAPGKAIDIVVDSVPYGTIYGHERQDVAAYFKTDALIKTGFTVTLPAVVNKPGPHKVVVRVVSADGASYLDSVTLDFYAQ